jgi:hypothetical protein
LFGKAIFTVYCENHIDTQTHCVGTMQKLCMLLLAVHILTTVQKMLPECNLFTSTLKRTQINPCKQLSASKYSSPTRHIRTLRSALQLTHKKSLLSLSLSLLSPSPDIRHTSSPSSNCNCSARRHVSSAHIKGFILAKSRVQTPTSTTLIYSWFSSVFPRK